MLESLYSNVNETSVIKSLELVDLNFNLFSICSLEHVATVLRLMDTYIHIYIHIYIHTYIHSFKVWLFTLVFNEKKY